MTENNNIIITNLIERVEDGKIVVKIAISEAMKALEYTTDSTSPSYDDALLYEVLEVAEATHLSKLNTNALFDLLSGLKQGVSNVSFADVEHVLRPSPLWTIKSSVIELLLNYPNW